MSKNLLEIIEPDQYSAAVLVDTESIFMLLEQEEAKKLRHLDHAEDSLIRGKGDGFNDMISSLTMTHEYLSGGRKRPNYALSLKMDGSPSLVWGYDPDTKKFFVGTKSVFNANPKVNYSDADVDANHGHQQYLSDRLKLLLKHLKSVTPKGRIFQGDLMYTSSDVAEMDGHVSFTPNTITYNVKKDSPEGKRVLKSKVGIAPHTEYIKGEDGTLRAKFGVDPSQFKKHDDIHFMDTKVAGPFKYTRADKEKFASHIERAKNLQKKLADPEATEIYKNHEKLLLAYINQAVKTKKENTLEGYLAFLQRQMTKNISNVKQDKTKDKIRSDLTAEMQNVVANKSVFNNLFAAHKQIQSAKNVLVNVMSAGSPYKENILGVPSKPEGYVVSYNNKPLKLVDRQHFSAQNFDWNEKANPEHNPTVLHWGRFNPVTKGHEKMLAKGADIARRSGAKQMTVATNNSKTDSENPLQPADKVKWLKAMFPGQEVSLAGQENSTIIAQLQQLHNKGVKHVTIVAGADRVPEYTRILAKYNGPGKMFHFHKARVVSSGERDPDSNDTDGISASKVRDAAKSNDYHSFKKGMPLGLDDDMHKELFHTVRAGLGVDIDHTTDNHALSIYSRRPFGDKIGDKARKEIQARKQAGKWHGKTKEKEKARASVNPK